jgi:hypothetical protein
MGPRRQRALSGTHLRTRKESREAIDRHPSPPSTYQRRPDTPTLSSLAPSDEGGFLTPDKRTRSRLRSISRSSSRLKLETNITEETIPPVPKNTKAK